MRKIGRVRGKTFIAELESYYLLCFVFEPSYFFRLTNNVDVVHVMVSKTRACPVGAKILLWVKNYETKLKDFLTFKQV